MITELCKELEKALSDGLPSQPGYCRQPTRTGRYSMGWVAVVGFTVGDIELCFIVAPTNPKEKAFRRSRHFDISYFSEDVPAESQGMLHRQHGEFIIRIADWLAVWDEGRPAEGETA